MKITYTDDAKQNDQSHRARLEFNGPSGSRHIGSWGTGMSSFGSTRYDAQLHMVAFLVDRIKSATNALVELEWDMTTPDLDTQRDPFAFSLPSKYWKAPFRYVDTGSYIADANGDKMLDIRGWGHLTGRGAHALSDEVAEKIQDQLGEHVAAILNADWPKTK